MRENLKTKFCEYIAVYMNDLYIAAQSPKDIVNTLKNKYNLKIKRSIKLSYDPGGTMICQLKKYIEELHEKFTKINFQTQPS